VGTVVAWSDGHVFWELFLVALLSSVAIHAGTNLVNEYFDYTQGVDRMDSLGPAGVILRGELVPTHVLWAGVLAFTVGSALGGYLVFRVGWLILFIGIGSILAGWFYTAKPFSLGYRGLGELEVFIFMGPIMVVGSYFVQTRSVTLLPLLISLPVGLLVMAILHANNLRDVIQDDERSRVTWVVLACRWLGFERGRKLCEALYCGMIVGAYIVLIILVIVKVTPFYALLALLTFPYASSVMRFVKSGVEGKPLSRAVRDTARLHMMFGATLALGYVFEILLHQIGTF
jgi:1,4-dihydroxy-2-naphthoate octaprenyltransferase